MKHLKRLLFALIPVLVLLVVAEGAARTLWTPPELDQSEDYLLPPHPTRIWAPRPGASMGSGDDVARIGEDGLRMVRLTGASLRVLTLGDSNIFGHGLPDRETLHDQLGQALTQGGAPTDVLTGGVPGYSSEQSRALMEELGWDLEPDLLVVANLLSDSTEEHFTDREWMTLLASQRQSPLSWVMRRSQLMMWLRGEFVETSRIGQRITWVRPPNLVASPRVSLRRYRANLNALLDGAKERGVGAVIFQLATARRYAGERDAQEYLEVQRQVAEARGVPIVDGLDALRESGLSEPQAFIDPVHASGPTNGLYAKAIAQAMLDAGWPQNRLVPE